MASDALGKHRQRHHEQCFGDTPPPAARRSIPAPTASTTHPKMARIAWERYQMGYGLP